MYGFFGFHPHRLLYFFSLGCLFGGESESSVDNFHSLVYYSSVKLSIRFRCTDCLELIPDGAGALLYVFKRESTYACGVLCDACADEIPRRTYVDFLNKSLAWISTKHITRVEDLFRIKREELSTVPHEVFAHLFDDYLYVEGSTPSI